MTGICTYLYHKFKPHVGTLLTNISKVTFEDDFPFPKVGYVIVPWRETIWSINGICFSEIFFDFNEDHPSHTVEIHELKSYVTGCEKNWYVLGDLRVGVVFFLVGSL